MVVADPPLAFVFWHRPRPSVAPAEYEAHLGRFHASLRAEPPVGLLEARGYRASRLPWEEATSAAVAYVDWYVLADFAALGRLNRAAIAAPHRASHDVVAGGSAHGQGSIYELRAGAPTLLEDRFEEWGSKPAGRATADHVRALEATAGAEVGSIWQRQLALGPPPEFCRRGRRPSTGASDALRVEVRPIV